MILRKNNDLNGIDQVRLFKSTTPSSGQQQLGRVQNLDNSPNDESLNNSRQNFKEDEQSKLRFNPANQRLRPFGDME